MMRRASTFSTKKLTTDAENLFARKIQNKLTLKTKTTTQVVKNGNNTSSNREEMKIPTEKLNFSVLDTVYVVGINQVGIVGFIGPTLFSEGIWVGIELLNGSFGKNDGSVLGQRYFECKPSHGIFVRPSYCTKVVADSINTNHHTHNNTNNSHTIPTAPNRVSHSPTSPSEYHVKHSHILDSGNEGGFRAMWVAAESLSASTKEANNNNNNNNNSNLPPPRIKSPSTHVDNNREQIGLDMSNTGSPLRYSPTLRGSPSLSLIPPPRKVTVELTIPTSPSKGHGYGNHTSNLVDASSIDTDLIIEKILESSVFSKKMQSHIDRAVEKALVSSLDTISHHINQRFISLESLVEVIGAAVAESCDKVDVVMTERQGKSHNQSEKFHDHFSCNVSATVAAMTSSGKEPTTPSRLPRLSSSNDLISSQKQHVDDCIVIIDALQIAQNINGNSPKYSPKHSPKSNRPNAGSAIEEEIVEKNNNGDDVPTSSSELFTPDPPDPYIEIARLRSALNTVSLLAREAQEEIALEREEMEDQINQLKDQLLATQQNSQILLSVLH